MLSYLKQLNVQMMRRFPHTSPWYYLSTHECDITEYNAASFGRWVIAIASNIINNNKFIEIEICRINTRDTQPYSSTGPDYWIVFFLRIALRFERLLFRVTRNIYTILVSLTNLTLTLLMWIIRWAPNKASIWDLTRRLKG
jgi:hypothetical protein